MAVGLFFGELTAPLKFAGDIFIKLLQITVLPYIMVSLITGIGRMDAATARRLAWRVSAVLLAIWALALFLVFSVALAFPDLDTASFFGSLASQPEPAVDLIELYLPANVFYSLANNLVPAVVLFSILLGVALIPAENGSGILPVLDTIATALGRINAAIVQLSPYGIFAIAAAAAGTMTVEELELVQVYLITYIALALLVTFWIFPGLVAALSGIPFREVLSTFRDALVTAFATGNQFVVLPLIAENCKTLLARHNAGEEASSAVDIIVPVSFNFPSLGKLLVLLFVLFAAWFTDLDLSVGDSLQLAVNGLFSLFGSLNVAVPYLLDSLQLPADMFQLFMITGVVVARFGAMLAALHIIVLSVLGALALAGKLRLHRRAVLSYLAVSVLSLVLLVLVLRAYFSLFVPAPPSREEVLRSIVLMKPRVEATVRLAAPAPSGDSLPGSRLDHIVTSGVLQVGYRPNNLPCSFLTETGELVGFDVEMAHILAEDMGLALEFLPFEFEHLSAMLNSGQIDLAMSCIASLPDRYREAAFSDSYLDLRLAFIVRDHEREDFADLERLQQRDDLVIAMVGTHYFENWINQRLPAAEFVRLQAAEQFFTDSGHGAQALVLSAEEGAAYSYRYPHFGVVPVGKDVHIPAVYALPRGDAELVQFTSNWIELKRKSGIIEQLYQYWMLGGVARTREPRWSILRDVLHWID